MKFHVFIATTQGVVAIQDVIPLNDPEIHSLISINGTATVANISSNYHHFVKKGSGIIHQDFSCCSFRINISERIDQGNSWQLAIYVAHLLADRNLLTYGDIEADDQIIIATGEVNTSNRNVQSVQHIQEKYNYIFDFISGLEKNNDTVKPYKNKPIFLIPEANINEFKQPIEVVDVFSVSQLSQLPSKISALTLGKNIQQIEEDNDDKVIQKYLSKGGFTKKQNRGIALVLGVALLGGLAVQVWTSPDKNIEFEQQTRPSSSLIYAKKTEGIDNNNPEKINELAHNIVEPFSLKTIYAKYQQCNEHTEEKFHSPIEQSFTSTNRHKLCQLSFITSVNVKQVFWLTNNKSSVLALKPKIQPEPKTESSSALNQDQHSPPSKKEWLIPLPKNQQRDVGYFLIAISNESDEQLLNENESRTFKKQLNDFLIKDIHSPLVTEKQLTSWLMANYKNKRNQVYQHKLIVY